MLGYRDLTCHDIYEVLLGDRLDTQSFDYVLCAGKIRSAVPWMQGPSAAYFTDVRVVPVRRERSLQAKRCQGLPNAG